MKKKLKFEFQNLLQSTDSMKARFPSSSLYLQFVKLEIPFCNLCKKVFQAKKNPKRKEISMSMLKNTPPTNIKQNLLKNQIYKRKRKKWQFKQNEFLSNLCVWNNKKNVKTTLIYVTNLSTLLKSLFCSIFIL